MKQKLIIILAIIILLMLIMLNNKIMPSRKEITDLELVRVIGLDYIDNPELSLVRNKLKATSKSSEGGDSEESSQEILTATGNTFIEISKKIQTYINKSVSEGHISYYLVGQETAMNDMTNVINFLIGANELRSSAKIYIIKDKTAKEFLDEVINPEYKIGEKIDSMELNQKELGIIAENSFKDLLEIITSDRKVGVVPTLKLVEIGTKEIEGESKNGQDFDFDGYAVFKGNKVVKFLTKEQSRAYNIINNKLQTSTITLNSKDQSDITISIVNSKTNIKFEFDGDNLKNIVIDVKLETDFKEAQNQKIIFEEIDDIEARQNGEIKKQIESVVKTSKDLGIEFIGILEYLRMAHPYKYEKIEKDWDEIWKNVNVDINVQSKIERYYDFIQE